MMCGKLVIFFFFCLVAVAMESHEMMASQGQQPHENMLNNDINSNNIIRPRSNTCPNLYTASNSRKLKYGSKVIILGTDNVEQRVPQYVGAEATIVDVPGKRLRIISFIIIISSSCYLV